MKSAKFHLWVGATATLLLFQNCGGGFESRLAGLSRSADALADGSLRVAPASLGNLKKRKASRMLAMMLAALPAVSGLEVEAGSCRVPRYYSYDLSSDVPLGCDNSFTGRTNIFNPTIPDEGMALTRATLLIAKSSANGPGGWSIGAYLGVGGGVASDMADNINPGASAWKTVLGSGELNPSYSTAVRLSGYNYSAKSCVVGDFTVLAGSRLEVWVEDPKPECRGKYLALKSLYATQTTPLTWGQDTFSVGIPATANATNILLLSSIEGTIIPCASGSLTTFVSTNLASSAGSGDSGPIPTAGQMGQCHLSLGTANWVSYSPFLTNMTLHLGSAVSNPVFSGYLQGTGTGEGVVGFVKQ